MQPSSPEETYIGRYKIIDLIGRGGMGVVYKAEDPRLRRTVAIKVLSPHYSLAEPSVQNRFMHEAQSAAALDHPNICTIYEIDQHEESLFIAMAYIDGETIEHKLQNGPVPPNEALEITIQILEGLQEAHEHQIIHRDIKASNLIIDRRGKVKILDFGIARHSEHTKLTQEGFVPGTVPYMSPEQAQGEPLDFRTDLWSASIVFFKLLTGQLPFESTNDQSTLYQIVFHKHPSIRKLRPGIPPSIERTLNIALSKKLEQRFQTAQEYKDALKKELINVKKRRFKTANAGLLRQVNVDFLRQRSARLIFATLSFLIVASLIVFIITRPQLFTAPDESLAGITSGDQHSFVDQTGRLKVEEVPAGASETDSVEQEVRVRSLQQSLLDPKPEEVALDDTSHLEGIPLGAGVHSEPDLSKESKPEPINSAADLALNLVQSLQLTDEMTRGKTVLVTPPSYKTFQFTGPFAVHLSTLIEKELDRHSSFRVVPGANNLAEITGDIPAAYEQESGADYVLEGSFENRDEITVFNLHLRPSASATLMAESSGTISNSILESIPIPLLPENFSQASSDLAKIENYQKDGSNLSIDVWTNKGNERVVFEQGETVKIYLRTNEKAFVYLIYHLADGTRTLLFKNETMIPSGEIFEIPDEFEVADPYGIEILQAIARSEPFDNMKTRDVDGYDILTEDLINFLANTRNAGSNLSSSIDQAESRMVITTVP